MVLKKIRTAMRGRSRALFAILAIAVLSVVGVHAAAGEESSGSDPIASGWQAQQLNDAGSPADVQNNLVPGALQTRDQAESAWRAATGDKATSASSPTTALAVSKQAASTDPLSKPEYVVVWAGNSNASDENRQDGTADAATALKDPLEVGNHKADRFVPGLDGFVVIDVRKHNADGSNNPNYGKVANFVQLPLPWGIEAESHHMQYDMQDGQRLMAGGLFNDTTFVMDVSKLPELSVKQTFAPQDTPNGSVPDAYDYAGKGRFVGTYMGGPEYNYAGSPGEVVTFKPDGNGGYSIASEVAGGHVDGRDQGNANGVPEPCGQEEAAPLNTCANPHGVQIRPDLNRMVTADYAEPKTVVLDPAKPVNGSFFRPTVRIFDTSDVDNPKLASVAHMGRGWRVPDANTMHNNHGVMEDAKTWPVTKQYPNTLQSKGFFAGAMCGGGVFFTPDVTNLKPDSSSQWNQGFDDGIALMAARNEPIDQFMEHEGPCEGGAWMQTSRNNKMLFRAVA